MKSHYEALDGLRGTAAFSVFLFHIWEMLVPDLAHNPMRHTFLAVDFFFALSGFVLGHAYDGRMGPNADAGKRLTFGGFVTRRLIRLHPMVALSMVVALAGYLLDPFANGQRIGVDISWTAMAATFLLSLLLVPTSPLPNTFGETHSMNGPSWTLFQEYIANLLYGLWGQKLGLRTHIGLCLIAAIALTLTALHFGDLGHGWGWSDFWVAPIRLACPFLLGLLVSRRGFSIRIPYPFFLLSLVLLAVFCAPAMGRFNGLFEAASVIVLFPLVLAAGAGVHTMTGWQGRACRFVGELSYPLYIIHYPFIYWFAHWNWSTNPDPMTRGLVACALYLAVIACAYAALRWYDKRVRAWLTRKYLTQENGIAADSLPETAVTASAG